jgi:hypothetical protein
MKKSLLFYCFLLLFACITNAQVGADLSGIAIQGIARDANNTAITNKAIALTLDFYFNDATGNKQTIISKVENTQTDAFGVFSLTVDTNVTNNPAFANNQAYLRISQGTTIISDEKLKSVPYSYAAGNGVPTGSIMPYMGTTAPAGWVLCEGQPLNSVPGSEYLRSLLNSSNAPDLRGMFLRGAGTNSMTNQQTTLGGVQDDAFKSHNHDLSTGSGTTDDPGNHDHSIEASNPTNNGTRENYNSILVQSTGTNTSNGFDNTSGEANVRSSAPMASAGEHTHIVSLTGNSGGTGDTAETRPVNYGVNYIIKL